MFWFRGRFLGWVQVGSAPAPRTNARVAPRAPFADSTAPPRRAAHARRRLERQLPHRHVSAQLGRPRASLLRPPRGAGREDDRETGPRSGRTMKGYASAVPDAPTIPRTSNQGAGLIRLGERNRPGSPRLARRALPDTRGRRSRSRACRCGSCRGRGAHPTRPAPPGSGWSRAWTRRGG